MTLSINVNTLSLCHQGSGGTAIATAPDVCKTPSPGGPVPIPYPNISFSKDLAKGTKTIIVDGGNPAAIKGSEFAVSTGDEPGTLGGIKSGTFKKESTWLSYSMDVKMEGRNVCRLSDKMLMNHGNTVCMGGLLQAPVEAQAELLAICAMVCICDKTPLSSASGKSDLKQECVEQAIIAADNAAEGKSPIKAEIPYDMTKTPPTPITSEHTPGFLRPTQWLPRRMQELDLKAAAANAGVYDVRIPDAVITRTPGDLSKESLTAPNLKAAVEIKFNNQSSSLSDFPVVARCAPRYNSGSNPEGLCR